MKKILLLAFLLAAGIAFSQTAPQPEGEIDSQEISDLGQNKDSETDTEALSETGEDSEELTEAEDDDKEKLSLGEADPGLPSSEDLGVKSPAIRKDPAKSDTIVFPQWAKDLRRAEIIAFGAYPISIFFSRIFLDLYRMSKNDWDRRYAPWPATASGGVGLTESELKSLFVIAACVSVTISVADHLIIRHKRKKAAAAAAAKTAPVATVPPVKAAEEEAPLEETTEEEAAEDAAAEDTAAEETAEAVE